MIKIVNKKTFNPNSISKNCIFYIGRGSPLGNPFAMQNQSEGERMRVIKLYKEYLNDLLNECKKDKFYVSKIKPIKDQLNQIYRAARNSDVYLICFCAPKNCHGDIIKEIIEREINKRKK